MKLISAIVEFDYTASELDELNLIKGAVITNIKVQPGGWWHGTIASTGKSGMFPDNFVKLLDQQHDDKVILRDKTSAKNRRCKVIYSYKESKEDELTLAVGDLIEVFEEVEDGWWKGKLGNKVGVFPSNFVELIDSTSPISANRKSHNINTTIIQNKINNNRSSLTNSREDLVSSHGEGDVPILPPKPIREMCKVLYAYAPVNDDELKLNEGDVVTILSKELPDKGWWKGELRGKIGVFPDNFVTLLPLDTTVVKERPERPPIGTKTIITTNSINTTIKSPNTTTNSYRKDSFGSKDSLSDSTNLINTERGGLFGNVAAHRRSLETKSLEVTAEKPPRKSLIITDANKTPSDIRKSLENLDEKKTTPPPVLSKKPTVPIKKSPSVSTVAGSIFSGLKSKVKSVESKLHSSASTTTANHDGIDGIGSSKLTGAAHVADTNEKGVIGERMKKDENEFDHVERGSSVLQDVRQNRAKAPKRRPPTSAGTVIGDSNNNVNMNGSHHIEDVAEPSSPVPAPEEELAKPKAREWEKHKAPWMAELKANQAKKTSPNVEAKSSPDEEKQDMSKSFSNSSFGQKKQETFEVRAASMEVKSTNSFDALKKEQPLTTISTSIDSNAKTTTKISITENSSSVMTSKVEDSNNHIRPTNVSLRNRSISPISRTSLNHVTKPSPTSSANVTSTHITSATTSNDVNTRVNELEQKVNKLETLIVTQNSTIDELRKMLKDESEKVRLLKNDLEKYAQCFTQV
ncbi:CLUMA_CG002612, isoform A [Clunio marinus]|uniref:CLUMA_CG002612, isoform A n=1 Tax=Clunio marinus TaxID=568069 RepID=A0A1J1HNI2_9DIPT|nr:CLUMA_CG002612, isoform A [Clunio marinus]